MIFLLKDHILTFVTTTQQIMYRNISMGVIHLSLYPQNLLDCVFFSLLLRGRDQPTIYGDHWGSIVSNRAETSQEGWWWSPGPEKLNFSGPRVFPVKNCPLEPINFKFAPKCNKRTQIILFWLWTQKKIFLWLSIVLLPLNFSKVFCPICWTIFQHVTNYKTVKWLVQFTRLFFLQYSGTFVQYVFLILD